MLRSGDLVDVLKISSVQESRLFDRLNSDMMITQIRRGLYLVPPKLPLGVKWSPSDILAINTLIEDRNGSYQICGPNAFNRYGFDEQVPTRVYLYNNLLSKERVVGSVSLTLIKVSDDRLGDVEVVETMDGEKGCYASRRRTLLDAVYDWSRFNTLPRAYGWIEREMRSGRVSATDLIEVTLRYGDVGTIRRIGFVLQRLKVPPAKLEALRERLRPTSAFIPLIPGRPSRGSLDRLWGVVINGEW